MAAMGAIEHLSSGPADRRGAPSATLFPAPPALCQCWLAGSASSENPPDLRVHDLGPFAYPRRLKGDHRKGDIVMPYNGGTRSPPQLGSHRWKGLRWSRPGASGGARRRACSAQRFKQRLPTVLGPFQAPCVSSHIRARTTRVPNVHPGSFHGCGGSLHPGRPRCRAPTASRASRTV